MRRKEKDKKSPTLTVVNGWERKNFIIKQGHKDDEISVEFVVKYKNHKTSNVDFEILEIDDDEEIKYTFKVINNDIECSWFEYEEDDDDYDY